MAIYQSQYLYMKKHVYEMEETNPSAEARNDKKDMEKVKKDNRRNRNRKKKR